MLDCVVVGAGPGGLVASIYLARYLRRFAVIDAGNSRATWIPATHNYPGFLGISGRSLLERLRTQAQSYGVDVHGEVGHQIEMIDGGYSVETDKRVLETKTVILATGLEDIRPDFDPSVSNSARVRMCPVCDAYEARDSRVGVLGGCEEALQKAKFLRTYAESVTLFSTTAVNRKIEDEAYVHGIAVKNGPFSATETVKGLSIRTPIEVCDVDFLYPALGCYVRSNLVAGLGVALSSTGTIRVDEHQQTSVDGIFAVGDVVADLHQITVAMGHAAIAATAVHKRLQPCLRGATELPRSAA